MDSESDFGPGVEIGVGVGGLRIPVFVVMLIKMFISLLGLS